jgi:D-3-phosphoglycerate dehydrogenase (EC 1.1.1.95)
VLSEKVHRCVQARRPHRRRTLSRHDRCPRGGFDVRNVDGTDRPALLSAISDADAILIRSATKVDAEAIAAASRLKVIARAGVASTTSTSSRRRLPVSWS